MCKLLLKIFQEVLFWRISGGTLQTLAAITSKFLHDFDEIGQTCPKYPLFLKYVKKKLLQLVLCSIVCKILRYLLGFQLCSLSLVYLHSQTVYIFCLNTALQKQQLCGVDAFLLTVVSACIRPCDTNNSTQSLTRMYHHTAIESQQRLRSAKTSWKTTLAGVFYKFGFVRFSIRLECKISGSSAFSPFSQ